MARDSFGFGIETDKHESSNDFGDFGQVLTSLGIDPETSQANLQAIYNEAEQNNNTKITSTLDKYYDWWN